MRRKRMKSNLVSGGMMCSRGINPSAATTLRAAMPMRTAHVKIEVKAGVSAASDRHALRPDQSNPPGDDQSRQRKGGEQRGHNAEAERDGKSAHRPGTDKEQHSRGDERRDVGVEDGRKRAREPGVDGSDGRAAAADLLAYALIDQHIRVDRDANRQYDAANAGKRQRRTQKRENTEDHCDVDN